MLIGCGKDDSGGYYSDDGPPSDREVATAIEPTPVPNPPLAKTGNDPYEVYGKNYYPRRVVDVGYTETGVASWYGTKFHGKRTSSGEPYDMMAFTAAHKTLPIPSYVRVTSLDNNRSVIVKVNDRGPFLKGRIIDLSYVAAKRIGIDAKGTGMVRVEVVDGFNNNDEPEQGQAIALDQPLEIKPQPLEPLPISNEGIAVSAGMSDTGVSSESQPLTSDSPYQDTMSSVGSVSNSGAVIGDQDKAVVLERKTVQVGQPVIPINSMGSTNQNSSTNTMSDSDDIILPSVPGTPTAHTTPAQAGPVVDISSILRQSDYFIQAGAFSTRENAYRVYRDLLNRGYTSRVLTGSDGVYRVQIGPYTSESEASATMGLLTAAGDTDLKLIKP